MPKSKAANVVDRYELTMPTAATQAKTVTLMSCILKTIVKMDGWSGRCCQRLLGRNAVLGPRKSNALQVQE